MQHPRFTLNWYQSEICCHNANIEQSCSIYSPDNYTCSNECYDLPQEIPKKEDRSEETKRIEFYFPRQGKCPFPCWKGKLTNKTTKRENPVPFV